METFDYQLKSLKQDLNSYADEIINHISTLHSNYHNENISLRTDPKLMVQSLQQDVISLVAESQKHSEYLEQNCQEIDECRKLMEVLTTISTVSEMINQCDELVHGNDILLSSQSLLLLKDQINLLPSTKTEIGTGKVCLLLRREFTILLSKFQTRLKRLLRNCIHIEQGKVSVNKKLKGGIHDEEFVLQTPILLNDIWKALIQMSGDNNNNNNSNGSNNTHSICSEFIGAIVNDVWIQVIRPLWRLKKVPFPHITRGDDMSELMYDSFAKENVASLIDSQMRATEESQHHLGACRSPFPQLLEHISTVLGFLWSGVFCSSEEVCALVATHLHSPPVTLTNRLVECLIELIPKTESELLIFQNQIHQPCIEFETRMNTYGFDLTTAITATTTTSSIFNSNNKTAHSSLQQQQQQHQESLSEVANTLKRRYAKAKRREMLVRAREVLLADYHNTMLASGDSCEDDPSSAGDIGDAHAVLEQSSSFAMQTLRFEPCQVSLAAHRILRIVHEAFKQACGSSGSGNDINNGNNGNSNNNSPYSTTSGHGNNSNNNNYNNSNNGNNNNTMSVEMMNVLYQSARDCLELYLSIIPMKFADIIETVPHMGAVFYNDCCYIAHNTTLITYMYRQGLSTTNNDKSNDKSIDNKDKNKIDIVTNSTNNNSTEVITASIFQSGIGLIDFIPRYRVLGESKLSRHIDEQKHTLEELIARINLRTDEDENNDNDENTTTHHNFNNNAGNNNTTTSGGNNSSSTSLALTAGRPRNSHRAMAISTGLRLVTGITKAVGYIAVGGNSSGGSSNDRYDNTDGSYTDIHNNYNNKGRYNNEENAAMVVKHLERISGQWRHVLQQTVYENIMGYLLEFVLRSIMKPILESECISEVSGAEVSRVMKNILSASRVFQETDVILSNTITGGSSNNNSNTNYENNYSNNNNSTAAEAAKEEKVLSVCASWKKFIALMDLLEYSLNDIAEQLPYRKFNSFTGQEMCHLIKALFEDSPRRQTVLNSVLEMTS